MNNSLYFSQDYPHCCFYLTDMYCAKSLGNLEIRKIITEMLVWLQDNKVDFCWSDEKTELTDLKSIVHVVAGLMDKPITNSFSAAILFKNIEDMTAFVLRFSISSQYAKTGYTGHIRF